MLTGANGSTTRIATSARNWDPALIDALANDRRVVTFDNAGVGGSTGTTPSTITQDHALLQRVSARRRRHLPAGS
jgi:pimeloyl-ACP methyl ester carboxylesterase